MILDSLAERYGKLPSEVLDQASTLDLWVYDVAVSYRNYQQEKRQKSQDPGTQSVPVYDPEDLKRKLEEFRERQNRS